MHKIDSDYLHLVIVDTRVVRKDILTLGYESDRCWCG